MSIRHSSRPVKEPEALARTAFSNVRAALIMLIFHPLAAMSAQEMVNLIEELVEIKVRHHAAMSARSSAQGNREIARAISQMNVADRDRLQHIKATLVRTFEGSDQAA